MVEYIDNYNKPNSFFSHGQKQFKEYKEETQQEILTFKPEVSNEGNAMERELKNLTNDFNRLRNELKMKDAELAYKDKKFASLQCEFETMKQEYFRVLDDFKESRQQETSTTETIYTLTTTLGNANDHLNKQKRIALTLLKNSYDSTLIQRRTLIEQMGEALKIESTRFADNPQIKTDLIEICTQMQIATNDFKEAKQKVQEYIKKLEESVKGPSFICEDPPVIKLAPLPDIYEFYQSIIRKLLNFQQNTIINNIPNGYGSQPSSLIDEYQPGSTSTLTQDSSKQIMKDMGEAQASSNNSIPASVGDQPKKGQVDKLIDRLKVIDDLQNLSELVQVFLLIRIILFLCFLGMNFVNTYPLTELNKENYLAKQSKSWFG